jgi:uncharacterized protein
MANNNNEQREEQKQSNIHKRGFGTMKEKDPERLHEIASKGGHEAHSKGAHEWTSEEAREAGRKGGTNNAMKNRGKSEDQEFGKMDEMNYDEDTY